MKVNWSPLLIKSISGPTKTINFKAGREGDWARRKPPWKKGTWTRTKLRYLIDVQDDPEWQVPPGPASPPVAAHARATFKVCDRFYMFRSHFIRKYYRAACKYKRLSPYDCWMKQCIPHLLRKLWKSQIPLKTVGRKLHVFEPDPRRNFPHVPHRWHCHHVKGCQVYGLHYARFDCNAIVYQGPDPDDPDPDARPIKFVVGYESRFYAESFRCYQQKNPAYPHTRSNHGKVGYYQVILRGEGMEDVDWLFGRWQRTGFVNPKPMRTLWPPRWCQIRYCPPIVDDDYNILEWHPNFFKMVNVFWLRRGFPFYFWPQWYPSKKGDHLQDIEPFLDWRIDADPGIEIPPEWYPYLYYSMIF